MVVLWQKMLKLALFHRQRYKGLTVRQLLNHFFVSDGARKHRDLLLKDVDLKDTTSVLERLKGELTPTQVDMITEREELAQKYHMDQKKQDVTMLRNALPSILKETLVQASQNQNRAAETYQQWYEFFIDQLLNKADWAIYQRTRPDHKQYKLNRC